MPAKQCPQCGGEMTDHDRAGVVVAQCTQCDGLFLSRADRGMLIEMENDWHLSSGPSTQPIPRITAGMTAPIATESHQARAFIDLLFG